ncbi:hypothetical protein TRFO_10338 [Tritrichomonas foetus]|uniref:Uncharacterized protein n=1 Tax=Tritrichomonas foetus TaxID=1144522 RepID=A0A1J4J944_9EUKA|nr:hypothetical protein TRFO_10338 [Tritrichomonas foetus]|eukprot:OHS95702.1 hypothetical protein TRFO_10338 [Tritrichomonas foetus]
MTQNNFGYNKSSNYSFGKTQTSYNSTANQIRGTNIPGPNADTITQLEFSRFGDPLLVSSGWDSTMRVWEFTDWNYQQAESKIWCKEPQNDAILRFAFSSDCDQIYYGTTAGEVKVLNLTANTTMPATGFSTNTAFQQNKFTPGTTAKSPFGGAATGTNFNSAFNKPAAQTGTGFSGFSQFSYQQAAPSGPNAPTPTTKLNFNNNIHDYYVSGLKWSDNYKLVISLTTEKTKEKPYAHSMICTLDPAAQNSLNYVELTGTKIINMDCVNDIVWFIAIVDRTPKVGYLVLGGGNRTPKEVNSQLQSMPTSIAALPSGQYGWVCSTVQGFVEICETDEITPSMVNQPIVRNTMYEGIFREEAPQKCIVYPATCVAVCPMDKKMAMACGKNEMAFFDLETGHYITRIPASKTNETITACAFSPSGEVFACAQGYDWSQGAEYMSKHTPKPSIFVGAVPDVPKDTQQ